MSDGVVAQNFFRRVGDLPLVQFLYVRSADVYGKVKERHALIKFSLDVAEKTLVVIVERTTPVISKFNGPLKMANDLACKSLDALEKKLPIITQSTDVIYAEIDKYYQENIKVPFQLRRHYYKEREMRRIVLWKDYGSKKVAVLLETPYGRVVLSKADSCLMVADSYVDKYLPEIKSEEDQPDDSKMTEDSDTLVKATFLAGKLRRRLAAHLAIQYQTAKMRAEKILTHLKPVTDLINFLKEKSRRATSAIGQRKELTKEQILKLCAAFNAGDPEVDGEKVLLQKLQYLAKVLWIELNVSCRRMVDAGFQLKANLRIQYTRAELYGSNLRDKLKQTSSIKEASDLLIQQVYDAIAYIRGTDTAAIPKLQTQSSHSSDSGMQSSSDDASAVAGTPTGRDTPSDAECS